MSSSRTRSAILLAAVIALWACERRPGRDAACDVRFTIPPPAGTTFVPGPPPALSPDGAYLAAVAADSRGRSRLWIRSLGRSSLEPVEGSDGASAPFWSPDGQHLGFFADGHLYRINRAGTDRQALAEAVDGHGGSWGPDGTIIFSAGSVPSIFAVASSGGALRQLTNIGSAVKGSNVWPAFLPDGKHFVYVSIGEKEEGDVFLGSLRSGDRDHVLWLPCSPVVSVTAGSLLCAWRGVLFAWPFDTDILQTNGQPSVLAQAIAGGPSGLASFTASADGSLVVYADAGAETVWVDGEGRETTAMPEAGGRPRLSPSGEQILVSLMDAGLYAVYDSKSGRWLGGEAEGASPARWAPDGLDLMLTSKQSDRTRVLAQRADGSGRAKTLFDEPGSFHDPVPASARADLLAIFQNQSTAEQVLRVVSLTGRGSLAQRTVWQRAVTPAGPAALSPDGRWLAYSSGKSGNEELYVTALDAAATPTPLGPAAHPVWSTDGRQLFYKTGRGIVAVYVEGAAAAWAARERLVIPAATLQERMYDGNQFDVSRDGTRVLLLKSGAPDRPATLRGVRSCGAGIATLYSR